MQQIKYIMIWLGIMGAICMAAAQNQEGTLDDIGRIALTTLVPDQAENIPPAAAQNLNNKLQRLATQNGLGAVDGSRFLMVAYLDVINKDVTATAPPMVSMNTDLTLMIVDYETQQTYSSTTVSLKGVGQNENKAIIQALRQVNSRNKTIQAFIDKGKSRIVQFYNAQCDFIIQKGLALADMQKFDEALYTLTSVPEVCKECYTKAMNASGTVYRKYLDFVCETEFAKAKSVWVANQNYAGANLAATSLAKVLPGASCYDEAQKLVEDIRYEINKDEDRNWDFMLQQWNDQVSLEQQRISAYRAVGVAYGQNQPRTTYQVDFLRP